MQATMTSLLLAVLILPASSAMPYVPVKHNNSTFQCPPTTCPDADTNHIKAAMQTFAYEFYTAKDVSGAFNTFVAEDYIQHNAGILSGREAAINALGPLFGSAVNTFDVKRLTVGQDTDNNTMVIIHLEALNTSSNQTMKTDVVDMYRVVGTCIVEHWDVLQAEESNPENPLAYF
ncbi:hypothetical protein E4T42_09174 [Aureobasidium subglaciale]|nr:hypothetical protein E4T42_09174 [Aureobasidium subglaciale]